MGHGKLWIFDRAPGLLAPKIETIWLVTGPEVLPQTTCSIGFLLDQQINGGTPYQPTTTEVQSAHWNTEARQLLHVSFVVVMIQINQSLSDPKPKHVNCARPFLIWHSKCPKVWVSAVWVIAPNIGWLNSSNGLKISAIGWTWFTHLALVKPPIPIGGIFQMGSTIPRCWV